MSYTSTPTADKYLVAENLRENEIQWVEHYNLQPEGAQTGLAADSTGVKYTGACHLYIDPQMIRHMKAAYLEVSKASSAGDETVTVELYNVTDAAVAASLEVTGATNRARSGDVSSALTMGKEYTVRWNVTAASATTGATFDARSARLIIIKGVS